MTDVQPLPRVVGIDPSLTGFALAAATSPAACDLFEWSSHGGKADLVGARIDRYRSLIGRALEALAERPALILLEGYSYGSRGSSVTLAEFGGVLRRALLDEGHPVVEVSPSELKKWATGKGNAGKPAVISALSKRYGRTFETDNEADAYGLAMMALQILGAEPAHNAAQRAIVQKLRTTWKAL